MLPFPTNRLCRGSVRRGFGGEGAVGPRAERLTLDELAKCLALLDQS